MCGIIGIASNKPVSINIINSLKKLEYRGYDSAGLATLKDNSINEKKCSGRVEELEKILFKTPSNGNIGIGTTTPASKLSVADSNGAGLEINPQTSNDRVILFAYDRAASTYQTMDFDATDFHFNAGGQERLRIDANGNIKHGASQTTIIDSSRNLTNIVGITSSGDAKIGNTVTNPASNFNNQKLCYE